MVLISKSLIGCKAKNDMKNLPNIIIILTDDQGYADASCYGSDVPTPNIDALANQGIRFTDFYAGSNASSPSRAALLTGCYPDRIGISRVIHPPHTVSINPNEVTLAELLKQKKYQTAVFGKWNVGHTNNGQPLSQGFDEFFGTYHSNDMIPPKYPESPLISNRDTVGFIGDQSEYTTIYTEKAVEFINRNHKKPFFLYLAHPMPHVPLAVSNKFKNKSGKGLYGDVIMEIDWSVGEIVKSLEKNNIADNTLIIFTSDNGPWLKKGELGGNAFPLREGKGTTFEGGHRVICVMRWNKIIPAGSVSEEPISSMDFLPTIASFVNADLPKHKIDGTDISALLRDPENIKLDLRDHYFFFRGKGYAECVRRGKWKLHLEHEFESVERDSNNRLLNMMVKTQPFALYDLENDAGETTDLSKEYPQIAVDLKERIEEFNHNLQQTKRKACGKYDDGQLD